MEFVRRLIARFTAASYTSGPEPPSRVHRTLLLFARSGTCGTTWWDARRVFGAVARLGQVITNAATAVPSHFTAPRLVGTARIAGYGLCDMTPLAHCSLEALESVADVAYLQQHVCFLVLDLGDIPSEEALSDGTNHERGGADPNEHHSYGYHLPGARLRRDVSVTDSSHRGGCPIEPVAERDVLERGERAAARDRSEAGNDRGEARPIRAEDCS